MHPTGEYLIKCNEKLKAVGVRNAIKFPFQLSTLNYLFIIHRHFGANAEVHENDAPQMEPLRRLPNGKYFDQCNVIYHVKD